MKRVIVLAYWAATSASSTSPFPGVVSSSEADTVNEGSEASSSGAKEADSSSAGGLSVYSGSLVGPSVTPFDHTGPTVGTTRSFESPPVVSLHLPPYRGNGEPTPPPPQASQQGMLVNVIDDGTVIHEISSPPNAGLLTRQRSQSRGVGFVGEGGSADLLGGNRRLESPLGFSSSGGGGGGTQHRSSAFFPRSTSGTGLSHLASARSVPVGSVPGYSAMTGGGGGPPTVMSPGNYHFTFATSVGGAAWSTGLGSTSGGGGQTLQPLTFTAYSYTGMSPLASTDATMSMRRAELADDVEATLYTPHVGDLSGLLKRCINPADVCYSEEDESSPTAGRGGGGPRTTPAFSSSAPPHLPKELHDWVFSIVYHRSFPSLSQDGSIGDCFKSFESLNNVVSSSVPSSLEDVGAAAAFDPEKVLKCLAHFDSSVADQTMRKALDTIHPAMDSVCQAYYESTESSSGRGGGGASSPVKTPTRFRSTGGGGTKKMMSGGAPSPTHPAHEIETMAWLANPALSVRFTMMLSAAVSSPAATEAGGCADHHHPGPSPLIATTRPMFLLYTRSDAEFENLRALWFVHSRSYRYQLLAKLVNSRNIFHWFKWESFPINLPDGASVHLKLRSEGGPHVFLESEFFFPETVSHEFRFNEHVSIIAKDFLMYPHRVYFGIGPRFRCYIDTLDQHLSHLVRLYLRDSLGPAVAAFEVDDEEEKEGGIGSGGSSSLHRGGGATTTTRAQIEVGLFIDTIYNSPLMIVSSRMPVSDLDPSPIQRRGDPDSDDITLRRYSKMSSKRRLILWQQLRKRWQHVDNQFGMDCLAIKLIMMSGADGNIREGMGASLKGYEFCFTHANNVDMTILPMLMYYISANDANILSYCVPVMFTDMLGHLENGKLIDRAARLKGALAVANDQFSTLFGRPFSELASPPIPTWYMEHVNSPDIRLVNLFRDSPPVAVLVDQAPDVVELFEFVAATPQGSRAAWEVFKTKEIYTSRESSSLPEEVQAAISTMEWFIEEFVPANPHFVTGGTVSLEVFDKQLMEIIHNPVDRNNLRAWEEFKKNSPIYFARHELLEKKQESLLQILNVVEWYMDSYADGYWLDYKYPWYFITNVYGSKYNEIVAMGASSFEDRNATRVVAKFKSDISGIKHSVVDVIVESLEKEFVDPERFAERRARISEVIDTCLVDGRYIAPPPMSKEEMEPVEALESLIGSILFAQEIFTRLIALL